MIMMKKLWLISPLALMIGCSYFSPDYHKPDVAIPQSWSAQNPNLSKISESLPYLAWWQKFNDPLLNNYIESGLKNNLTIEMAKANLEAAQGQLLTVKLNWIPMLNLFGGYINGTTQNNFAPIGNLGLVNNTGAFFAVLPAYTINLFTNYTLQKQAGYNVEVAQNAELSIRLAVIGQVAAAYFTILAQRQLLVQFNQLENDAKELVTITEAMDKQGLANSISIDELRSKQQLVSGQIAIINKNLIAAENALRYLINQPPGKTVTAANFDNINPKQVIPGNLPVAVIASRPDVMKAEAQLKAANEGISIASSALLPGINLNYFFAQGAGSQTFNNPDPVPTVSSTNSNQQSYYAAYANWTISPSVFGQIDTNTAVFKSALANYKQVVNTALHEVDNALANNNGYNLKMVADTLAYKNLESVVATKKAMYNKGLTTYMLVLTSKIEKDIMAIDITQTRLQQMLSLVVLYQGLGGGYMLESEAVIKKPVVGKINEN